jgi:uncharacterized membrane protein
MPSGPLFGTTLLHAADDARLLEAIARAEKGSRGEIRVHVEQRCPTANPLDRARDRFADLNMHATADGTGVLLYVALSPTLACVVAGEGIHGAANTGFWGDVPERVVRGLADGRPVEGLLDAIDRIGELLRRVVADDDDARGNELPDDVSSS